MVLAQVPIHNRHPLLQAVEGNAAPGALGQCGQSLHADDGAGVGALRQQQGNNPAAGTEIGHALPGGDSAKAQSRTGSREKR